MASHLSQILDFWFDRKDQSEWVLATIFKTEKSAYRKAGSMMLIDGQGNQFGLLSGGCLEADIKRNAKRVMQTGKNLILTYDSMDEDNLAFQIGIGCGGIVHILLQNVTVENDLGLSQLRQTLKKRRYGLYRQLISSNSLPHAVFQCDSTLPSVAAGRQGSLLLEEDDEVWLETKISPDPHLLIVGGGPDAIPVVDFAKHLGWRVTVVDPRPANARREFFLSADQILRDLGQSIHDFACEQTVDAVILMAHSVDIDAQGLKFLHDVSSLKYLALLGPRHRYEKVVEVAGLSPEILAIQVAGPAGLDIGGDIPESIAFSILSECHAILKNKSAKSLSGLV